MPSVTICTLMRTDCTFLKVCFVKKKLEIRMSFTYTFNCCLMPHSVCDYRSWNKTLLGDVNELFIFGWSVTLSLPAHRSSFMLSKAFSKRDKNQNKIERERKKYISIQPRVDFSVFLNTCYELFLNKTSWSFFPHFFHSLSFSIFVYLFLSFLVLFYRLFKYAVSLSPGSVALKDLFLSLRCMW